MNIDLLVISMQLFARQNTITAKDSRDRPSLTMTTTLLPPQLLQGYILHIRFSLSQASLQYNLIPVPIFALQNYSESFKEKKRISGLGAEQLHQSSFPHSRHSGTELTP